MSVRRRHPLIVLAAVLAAACATPATPAAEPVGSTGRWRVALETRGTAALGDRAGRPVAVGPDAVTVGPSPAGVPASRRLSGTGVIRPW